jgi:hypothetical protein
MKKIYALMIAVMMTVTLASLVFASGYPANSALVAGKIYTNNFADTVDGATVNVTCGEKTITTTSLSDGAYVAKFNTETAPCNIGDTVTVFAQKDGLTGTSEGVVNNGGNLNLDINFAVVNVNLIPEFGLLVGTLTVVSAIAVFFIIRRK